MLDFDKLLLAIDKVRFLKGDPLQFVAKEFPSKKRLDKEVNIVGTGETQLEIYKRYRRAAEKRSQLVPEAEAAGAALRDAVYKDGALSKKVKRLISTAIGCAIGCTPCILGHTQHAVDAGATKEEIMEAVSVALAIRGTSGFSQGWRVAELLEELGLM